MIRPGWKAGVEAKEWGVWRRHGQASGKRQGSGYGRPEPVSGRRRPEKEKAPPPLLWEDPDPQVGSVSWGPDDTWMPQHPGITGPPWFLDHFFMYFRNEVHAFKCVARYNLTRLCPHECP